MMLELAKGLSHNGTRSFSIPAWVAQLLQKQPHGGVAEIETCTLNRDADVLRSTHDGGVDMSVTTQTLRKFESFAVHV